MGFYDENFFRVWGRDWRGLSRRDFRGKLCELACSFFPFCLTPRPLLRMLRRWVVGARTKREREQNEKQESEARRGS